MIGEDPLVDEILQNPEGALAKLFTKASQINTTPLKKRYVEACLLCSEDMERISDILEMDREVVDLYRKIYFDIEGFDRVEKLELTDVKNQDEAQLKMWALAEGIEFIAWRLGHRARPISPVDGLKQLYGTCLYKAKEAFFTDNTTDSSIQSAKWTKLSMDIARLLKAWTSDSNQAQTELDMRIQDVKSSFPSIARFAELFDEVAEKQTEANVEIPTEDSEGSD